MNTPTTNLSQRVRPGSEAAPWVCTEISRIEAENYALRTTLQDIEVKAQAGLCYFTLESAREFLKDIREVVADALGEKRPAR